MILLARVLFQGAGFFAGASVRAKRWAVLIVGWSLIAVGILGLFLPVLPGILFLVMGLLLLATEYAWARELIDKASAKYPKVGAVLNRATTSVERILAKIDGKLN